MHEVSDLQVFSFAVRRDLQVYEECCSIPARIGVSNAASSDTTLKLRLALKRSNADGFIHNLTYTSPFKMPVLCSAKAMVALD